MRIMNQSYTFTLCIRPYYVSEQRNQLSPEALVTQIIMSIQCDQNVHHLRETSVCKNHSYFPLWPVTIEAVGQFLVIFPCQL